MRAHVSRSKGVTSVSSIENNTDHPISGLGTADSLIIVPAGTIRLNAGETVKVLQIDTALDE